LTIIASNAHWRDFLPLRRQRRLLSLLAMILGFALIGERKLEVGEDLKAKGLVKSWGHLRFYL
jgi:hypothetical protein